MKLTLGQITLGVPDGSTTDFYTRVLWATADNKSLTMHDAGRFELRETRALAAQVNEAPAGSGFRGYVLSYIVDQPSEIEAVLASAVEQGAKVLKPAKKAMFAGFSAVFQSPDGSIWKLASANKKDTGPAAQRPVPTETAALLGVADPKASKAFYSALGMTVDRDYGNKYIDFQPAPGRSRFGLMQRPALAKDAGVGPEGSGFRAIVLTCTVAAKDEVDELLAAAESAGGTVVSSGTVVADGVTADSGIYTGRFADPDGFYWEIATR